MLKVISKNTFNKILRNPKNAFNVGKHRIAIQLAASCLKGYSPFPRNLTFFLTYRCNLRCHVCGQWGDDGYAKKFSKEEIKDEVDINTLTRVIDEIAPYKPEITMCGGEVLLYKDWYKFMRHVKSNGLSCILTTNGTLLYENAEKIVDIGLDKLSISIDGPEKIHNKARNSSDVFGRAIRGIKLVERYKKEKKSQKPILELGCTISDQNYRFLDDVVNIAEDFDISCLIFLHLAYVTDKELKKQTDLFRKLFQTETVHWSGYRYNPDGIDVSYLANKLEEIKSYKGKIPIIIHPDFKKEEIEKYYSGSFFLSKSYKGGVPSALGYGLCPSKW